jgi:hypothetical protein
MDNIGDEIEKISELEGDVNWWVYNGALTLLSMVHLPYSLIFIGIDIGWSWDQNKLPGTSTMGFKAGDVYLRIRTFDATGVDGVIMEGSRTQ